MIESLVSEDAIVALVDCRDHLDPVSRWECHGLGYDGAELI